MLKVLGLQSVSSVQLLDGKLMLILTPTSVLPLDILPMT